MTRSARRHLIRLFAAALCLVAGRAVAQEADLAFGGLRHDTSLPVEVAAESLSVDQSSGLATFSGNVVAAQGELRLSAGRILVRYADPGDGPQGRISQLEASDGVTLVNGEDAAEAERAIYSIDDATVVMSGNVLLTQGPNALSGEELTIDLATGSGQMLGGVRTILQTGSN